MAHGDIINIGSPAPAQVDKVLDQLSVGDIVTARRTYRVVERRGLSAVFKDVHPQNGQRYNLTLGANHGSLRIDMVKKVAKPKPKAGEFVTHKQLRETMWKSGTTIRYEATTGRPRTIIAVLQPNGRWSATAPGQGSWQWDFDAPSRVEQYELLHVA